MNVLDEMKAMFVRRVLYPHESRYAEFGLFDAHTGKRVGKKYSTRAAANAAKSSSKNPHRMRVRGIPVKKPARGVAV